MPNGNRRTQKQENRYQINKAKAANSAKNKGVTTPGGQLNFDLTNPAQAALFSMMFLSSVLPTTAAARASAADRKTQGNPDDCTLELAIKQQQNGQYAAVPKSGWGLRGTPENCQTVAANMFLNQQNPHQKIFAQLKSGYKKCLVNIAIDKESGIPTLTFPIQLTKEQLHHLQNPKKNPPEHQKVVRLLRNHGLDLNKICEIDWDFSFEKGDSKLTVTFPGVILPRKEGEFLGAEIPVEAAIEYVKEFAEKNTGRNPSGKANVYGTARMASRETTHLERHTRAVKKQNFTIA